MENFKYIKIKKIKYHEIKEICNLILSKENILYNSTNN